MLPHKKVVERRGRKRPPIEIIHRHISSDTPFCTDLFSLIRHKSRLKMAFLKTVAFLCFQILQSKNATLWRVSGGLLWHTLVNQSRISCEDSGTKVCGIQPCYAARSHMPWTKSQSLNRWSMDSKSSIHKGQTGLRLISLLRSVPRTGSAPCHVAHWGEKGFTTSTFIHFIAQFGRIYSISHTWPRNPHGCGNHNPGPLFIQHWLQKLQIPQ